MTRHPRISAWRNYDPLHDQLAEECGLKPRREIIFPADEWREIFAFTLLFFEMFAALSAAVFFAIGIWAFLKVLGV